MSQKVLAVLEEQAAVQRLRDATCSPDLYAFLFADAVDSLEQSDKKVLSALSAFQTAAAGSALAAATGLPTPQIELALERLVTLSLVNDLEDGRYGLHPLTRRYVQAALGASSEGARAAQGSGVLAPGGATDGAALLGELRAEVGWR